MDPDAAREAIVVDDRRVAEEIVEGDSVDAIERAVGIRAVSKKDGLVKDDVLSKGSAALWWLADVPREQHGAPESQARPDTERQQRVLQPHAPGRLERHLLDLDDFGQILGTAEDHRIGRRSKSVGQLDRDIQGERGAEQEFAG